MKTPLPVIRIVEFEGLGPGPLAGRMLTDMGADVTVVVRPGRRPLLSSSQRASGVI
jgi:alpha-methylacyl-CoA racemase